LKVVKQTKKNENSFYSIIFLSSIFSAKKKEISSPEKKKKKRERELFMRTQHVYTPKKEKREIRNKIDKGSQITKHDRCGAGGVLVSSRCYLFGNKLGGGNTNAVVVAVEENALALALGAFGGLNPLASTGRGPHGLEEAERAGVGLSAPITALMASLASSAL
jgi:hypothetical protein